MVETTEHKEGKLAIKNNINNLVDLRNESIRQFSLNAGISYTTAHDLYTKKSKAITFELMDKLCGYFGVGPSELFPYTPGSEKKDK